ncbi:tetratricopeptide repeat protein [Candidatus Microgenomates bacterium]|nr:tetratricopeptide repeat protein [Candidatus Microgenomates bacterium]
MDSQGKKLHGEAAHAREAGEHLKALQLADEAMLAYQQESNAAGFAEVLADRSIVLRHLAEETKDKNFLALAKAEMEASVQIAHSSLALYNLAKVEEALGEYSEAIKHYKEAISNQNSPAIIADYKVHLTTCEYKSGDKSALDRAEQAISELESSEEEKYSKDVWLSGGHMRIAAMLRGDDPTKAREHLKKAKEIIDANLDLKLRKGQFDKLAATF